jgi:dipeptidase E
MPDTPWVDAAEAAMTAAGLTAQLLDLEQSTSDEVAATVAETHLVFVTGGYAIFLLQHARRTGFLDAVRPAAAAGRVAYVGFSAGAALAAPDLARYRGDDDPGRVTDTAGLGLVPFYPLVHADRGREQRYRQLIADEGDRYDFVPIRDDQAVVVRGSKRKITPS